MNPFGLPLKTAVIMMEAASSAPSKLPLEVKHALEDAHDEIYGFGPYHVKCNFIRTLYAEQGWARQA